MPLVPFTQVQIRPLHTKPHIFIVYQDSFHTYKIPIIPTVRPSAGAYLGFPCFAVAINSWLCFPKPFPRKI
ncbi:uncharacterized protein Bfra_006875 [Botrytis fragariae]|uniref:Uncharacterized protein n=1 Tax=Botrytis fragariae TaxID=1964551 RepID=A0A8H6B589_9HELO|nr:uncharacterized protein Bfra_006875 [Botrytis fragariae]KAF5879668.1 hypothetical protein Bfra_006875 [Botrytis fragariae]